MISEPSRGTLYIPIWRLVQYAVITALTLLIVAQVLQSWRGPSDPALRNVNVARDFKTFYCAGAAANAGRDPYLVDALARCGTPDALPIPSFAATGVWAAPLPAYDIAVFRVVALLPYHFAALFWLGLCVAALTVSTFWIASMARLQPLAVFCAFALPLYYANLEWGQLPPLVVTALVIVAYCLRRGAYAGAALACLATMLEPHLGGPICLIVFLFVPKTRVAIVCGAAGLALLSVATLGFDTNVAYVRTILPLQAIAEAPASNQYSLTWLAYFAGVPEPAALKIGSASYAIMVLLAAWIAAALRRANAPLELIPLVAAGAVVLGGPFVHSTQACVSLVLALMLLAHVKPRSPVLFAGILLQVPLWYLDTWLAQPWTLVRLESILAIAYCAFAFSAGAPRPRRIAAALGAGAVYVIVSFGILHAPHAVVRTPATASTYAVELGPKRAYTTGEWGVHIRADQTARESTAVTLASKIPLWIGLICVFAAALGYSRRHTNWSMFASASRTAR